LQAPRVLPNATEDTVSGVDQKTGFKFPWGEQTGH